MAREINTVCDFIFGSIHTGLPMDTGYVELTIRMVKGIYTYRKDHTTESMVFSPWISTIIPFPSLHKKIQAFQDENRRWPEAMAMPHLPFLPLPRPNVNAPQERPEPDGLTKGIISTL